MATQVLDQIKTSRAYSPKTRERFTPIEAIDGRATIHVHNAKLWLMARMATAILRGSCLGRTSSSLVRLTTCSTDAISTRSWHSSIPTPVPSRPAAVEGPLHGHEGIRRWWNNLLASSPDHQVEVLELRDLGPITLGKIVVGGHSAESGIAPMQMAWHLWRWRL